jgi:hypothetical protein
MRRILLCRDIGKLPSLNAPKQLGKPEQAVIEAPGLVSLSDQIEPDHAGAVIVVTDGDDEFVFIQLVQPGG